MQETAADNSKHQFMIQRIQTVFLLLVATISVLLLFFPFVQYEIMPAPVQVSLLPTQNMSMLTGLIYLPIVLNLVILLLSVYIIAKFKKRVLQMKLANLLMAMSGVLLGVMLFFDYLNPSLAATPMLKQYLWGAYLPIISVIASFLAARFIKKDEELVRSADRLR